MSLADSLQQLSRDLEAPTGTVVLDAAWEVFLLGENAADAIIRSPAYDELVAALAALSCTQGRNALPWPTGQTPGHFPIPFDAADAVAVAAILGRAGENLVRLADIPGQQEDDREALREIAGHATAAGRTLAEASVR